MEAAGSKLKQRLRDAGAEALEALVRRLLDQEPEALGETEVGQILSNPHAGREVLELLAGEARLTSLYRVRSRLARHPRLPQVTALNWIPTFFWRELMEISLDPRLPPLVRRSAERQLTERLPGMALGEKVALARRAGPGALAQLRFDPAARVIAALLENPRTTEGTLVPLAARRGAPPEILGLVAKSRWGRRPLLRRTLARNPGTPPQLALGMLEGLARGDLAAVAGAAAIHSRVRRRAREMLEKGTSGDGRTFEYNGRASDL